MTIEELSKLPDEELRVRCAELCGYHLVRRGPTKGYWKLGREFCFSVPDYPSDLNAMAEAEKSLPVGRWTVYENSLMTISKAGLIATGVPAVDAARICTIGSTARQRCIAFIAVMQSA